MEGMSIQKRYEDIARISGFSEEVVKRVLKATRESVAKSLKDGQKATIPGLATITPSLRKKPNYDLYKEVPRDKVTNIEKMYEEDEEYGRKSYIKLKATASSALSSEMEKIDYFSSIEDEKAKHAEEESRIRNLNFVTQGTGSRERYSPNSNGIITSQISSLM